MTESTNPTPAQQNTTTFTSSTLGQQLKLAREALNLSIEDVSKKTSLKKSHLEAIESDIFILKGVAPTFVRGYVRNYVRFLKLPESLVSSVNYGEVKLTQDSIKTTTAKPLQPKSNGTSLKYLTILVLLTALGMTFVWWWQDYQKEQANREQFVNTAPITANTTNKPTNETILATSQTTEQEEAQITSNIPVQVGASSPLGESTTTEANTEISSAENITEPDETQTDTGDMLQQTTEIVTVQNENIAEPSTATNVANNDELRIEITGSQSWITVRGAKNKRLAEKLYNNGETLTFNDNEQYRLTIGAPANVKLYYKGQEVPLKIDGRVVRIRLPLAQ